MACILRVTGVDFHPELVLAGADLQPYDQWRSGDLQTHGPSKGQPWDYGGLKLVVSDAEDLREQIRDACGFLKRALEPLRIVVSAEGVEDARLDFGYFRRPVVAQFDYLPPDLLRLAAVLGLGIELSLYRTSDDCR